jgi:hypothetical protein
VLRNGPESVGSSFHGSLSLLFHLGVFLSDFHFRSRQLLGGQLIVDELNDISQDFLFGHGSIDRFPSLANGWSNLQAGRESFE